MYLTRVILFNHLFNPLVKHKDIQEYRDTGIQRYRDTWIQGYMDTGKHGYMNTGNI